MDSIGSDIISSSRANLKASEGEKTLGAKRDLLSVLLKSNSSENVVESHRLTDAEILARKIPTYVSS